MVTIVNGILGAAFAALSVMSFRAAFAQYKVDAAKPAQKIEGKQRGRPKKIEEVKDKNDPSDTPAEITTEEKED